MATADKLFESKVAALLGQLVQSPLRARLGDQFAAGARHVVRKFESEWPSPSASAESKEALLQKCERTLALMADVRDLMRAAEQVYRVFLPRTLLLQRSGSPPEKFCNEGLDGEGRPIYRLRCSGSAPPGSAYLRWHNVGGGGVWAAHTDAAGEDPGDLQLDSPLPIDPGVWRHAGTGDPAKDVSCLCDDMPVLEPEVAEALSHCWDGERCAADACEASAEALAKSALGGRRVSSGETVLQVLTRVMEAMCSVAERIEIGKPQRPQEPTWPELFASLQSLASLSGSPVWSKVAEGMPESAEDYEITWAQCKVYVCRLLDVCDVRLTSAPWLLRLCHRCFLRSWQEQSGRNARIVDMQQRMTIIGEPGQKPAGALRFVAVSDTHGWDRDLRLPDGDVLLHCGNLLFHGTGLGHDLEVPSDLQAALEVFHRASYQRYKWIFLVGGNHDRSLHQLWAENHARLCERLPENLVVLQAPADLRPALQGTCLARDGEEREKAEDGAIKLLPDFTLCGPSDPRPGWVIAGSGVTLARGGDSASAAFQLRADSVEAAQAAEALRRHCPDVVMTHGPPKGHRDGGQGDEDLADAVIQCPSVRVHVFGHAREAYGTDFGSGRCWINAALSSPLLVPAAEPVVFDLLTASMAYTNEKGCCAVA